jgi:hypothetical protein
MAAAIRSVFSVFILRWAARLSGTLNFLLSEGSPVEMAFQNAGVAAGDGGQPRHAKDCITYLLRMHS